MGLPLYWEITIMVIKHILYNPFFAEKQSKNDMVQDSIHGFEGPRRK